MTMDRFDVIIPALLRREGPFVDHPADRGGPTAWGIASKFHPDVDVRILTVDTAKDWYRRNIWEKYGFERFPAPLDERMFDMTVNMGWKGAVLVLQRALRAVTGVTVTDDGILGEQTLNTLALAVPRLTELMTAIRCEHAGYYRLLAAIRPTQNAFLKGWLNRAYAR